MSPLTFAAPDVLRTLAAATAEELDSADFGIVKMDSSGKVVLYNTFESKLAVLAKDKVIGRRFFAEVAICANNHLVADRYEEEAELDATIDYVFAFEMRRTQVQLRLLKSADYAYRFLLVKRR
jgi:photoactive yellow protein